jgi:hypothetical protein
VPITSTPTELLVGKAVALALDRATESPASRLKLLAGARHLRISSAFNISTMLNSVARCLPAWQSDFTKWLFQESDFGGFKLQERLSLLSFRDARQLFCAMNIERALERGAIAGSRMVIGFVQRGAS